MKKLVILAGALAPVMAFGQEANVDGLIGQIGGWVASLTPIAFALGLLFFFFGLAKFILKSGEDKESGKNMMIWGVVAIFVMASVFGLVRFLQSTFNISDNSSIDVPSILNN